MSATPLRRRDVVARLLANRPDDLLAVAGLGSPAWDLANAGDHPGDFHFIGAMGQAAPFALGLAMAQPTKPVLLVTGDGEMLMGIGSLAAIARHGPANLTIVVLDNGVYGETGGQPTATSARTDLVAVARGFGIDAATRIINDEQVDELRAVMGADGPRFAVVDVMVEDLPLVLPTSLDGVTAINRFRGEAMR